MNTRPDEIVTAFESSSTCKRAPSRCTVWSTPTSLSLSLSLGLCLPPPRPPPPPFPLPPHSNTNTHLRQVSIRGSFTWSPLWTPSVHGPKSISSTTIFSLFTCELQVSYFDFQILGFVFRVWGFGFPGVPHSYSTPQGPYSNNLPRPPWRF